MHRPHAFRFLVTLFLTLAVSAATAQDFLPQFAASCLQDIATSCANVKSGGGRIARCLQAAPTASAGCKAAVTPNDGPAGTVTITVAIAGVRSKAGTIIVSLGDDPKTFPNGRRLAIVPANETAVVTFHGLKPGTYAVTAFHDENENAKFEFGSEGFATTKDALLPPMSFEDGAVKVSGDTGLSFFMRYF